MEIHLREIVPYLLIGNSLNLNDKIVQKFSPIIVILDSRFFKLLASVEFNHQMRFIETKIDDVLPNDFLAMKTHRASSKKLIPKFIFFCRGIVA